MSISAAESNDEHNFYMQLALDEAAKCIPTPSAFCVGAVIVSNRILENTNKDNAESSSGSDGLTHPEQALQARVLSTGYSREMEGNTHAEQCAIDKLLLLSSTSTNNSEQSNPYSLLSNTSIYTTMEPCSIRLSGNLPCTDRILQSGAGGITRVYLGVMEPDDFVRCEGVDKLRVNRVQVVEVKGWRERCLAMAKRGHEV